MYANVDNRIVVFSDEQDEKHTQIPVVVPTELFTLMKDVLKIDTAAEANLFLDIDRAYATFGLNVDDGDEFMLWFYTAATLPAFLQPYVTLDEL